MPTAPSMVMNLRLCIILHLPRNRHDPCIPDRTVSSLSEEAITRQADNKRHRGLSYEEYHKLLKHCEGWLKLIVAVAA